MPLRVNDIDITEERIREEMQYHPATSLDEAHRAARNALIVRTLLLVEAKRSGTETAQPFVDAGGKLVEAPDEALIRALIDTAISLPEPSEEECRTYHAENATRFRSPDLLQTAHILFAADPKDETAMVKARARAEDALCQLREDGSRFEGLARELSDCPSGQHGGALGQVTRGSTIPEFETVLFALEPGQICPVPIRTRYGYHIARLDKRLNGRPLPYDSVRLRIRAYLAERNWREAVHDYIGHLLAAAEIDDSEPPAEAGGCGHSCGCARTPGARL